MSEHKKLTAQQLALYLKCDVQHFEGGIFLLEGIDSVLNEVNIRRHSENRGFWELLGNVDPILRPLSDMTEAEGYEIARIQRGKPTTPNPEVTIRDLKIDYVDTIKKEMNILKIRFIATEGVHCPLIEENLLSISTWGTINTYVGPKFHLSNNTNCIQIIEFLISKHFDVLGWILQGYALDKTKLK